MPPTLFFFLNDRSGPVADNTGQTRGGIEIEEEYCLTYNDESDKWIHETTFRLLKDKRYHDLAELLKVFSVITYGGSGTLYTYPNEVPEKTKRKYTRRKKKRGRPFGSKNKEIN